MRVTVECQPVGGSMPILVSLLQTVLKSVLADEPVHLIEGPISHHVKHIFRFREAFGLANVGNLPAVPLFFFAVYGVMAPTSANIIVVFE